MNLDIWKQVWNDFCESHTHLDSLVSKIHGPAKIEVAIKLGAFLRRPWSIAQAFGIQLDETPDAFWNQNFIDLKKNEAIHETLKRLSGLSATPTFRLPNEGSAHDFPPLMVENWRADWGGAAAERLCALLSQDPLTVIRVHRDTLARAAELFPKSRAGRFSPSARVFKGYESVLSTEVFAQGGLEIQDEGSQVMAWFALFPEIFGACLSDSPQIKKSEFVLPQSLPSLSALTVVDACAGAGGKTLALADILRGQGRIYAYDIYEKKIQALRKRASRAHETNIQAMAITSADSLKKFEGSADVILIDSPCSGQGVLRRNPDIKWNRKPFSDSQSESRRSIEELQQQVVSDYLPLLKNGGRLVYGVCTFQKSETVAHLETIADAGDLKLTHSGFIGPYETDGFFMAAFEKI